jgi:glycosyltransferase involved in cell wall biosynthesis
MSRNIKKILVFLLNDPSSGINKYRISDPHIKLQTLFKDEFYIELAEDREILNTERVKKFDAIFYHSVIEQIEAIGRQTDIYKSMGIKLIVDIDDYFEYHALHPYYAIAKNIKLKEKTLAAIKKADLVTTTSEFFVDVLRKYNKNVVCLPNSINFKEKQYQINSIPHETVNIGYVAGSSHLEDIKLLRGVMSSTMNKNIQMQLCGFNSARETALNSVWHKMEIEFTDNYAFKDNKFIEYLHEFIQDPYPYQNQMKYKRVWTKPINSYCQSYDEIDIALAPLQDNKFNYYKSNLKMLEAGVKKKPIIVSGVQPYLDGEHEKNCLIVDPRKEHKNWMKYVKQLVESEQMRIDMGENLYQYVFKNFNLDDTTKIRAEIYRNLL